MTTFEKQYKEIKNKHKNCPLLFKMGDFYEAFYDDAEKIADILRLTLTKRGFGKEEMALAGFPYWSLDANIDKLTKAGFKIVVIDQNPA